jgi:hypothetical protein
MNDVKTNSLSDLVQKASKVAVAEAIERHRRLGQSIVVSHHGEIIEVKAEEIPDFLRKVAEEAEEKELAVSQS